MNFSFAFPAALAALVLIPLILLAYVVVQRRRVKYALRFTNLNLLANVVDRAPRWRRHIPPLLFLTALTALIVGIARPQIARAVSKKQGTIILAIDRSGSMQATDVSPSRIAAAKAAATEFVQGLPSGFKVGLVSFSNQARTELQPTFDRARTVRALNALEAQNGTALGDALAQSVNLGLTSMNLKVDPAGSPLVVLLLSDGANTTGTTKPLAAAAQAKRAHVPVYTVALGTSSGTITITDPNGGERVYRVPPDPATLRAISKLTGGQTFQAADLSSLKGVYSKIGLKVGQTVEQRELTSLFAAAGAVFLVAGAGFSLLWFNRLP